MKEKQEKNERKLVTKGKMKAVTFAVSVVEDINWKEGWSWG